MSCAGKYFRCLSTTNSIQSSDKEMFWNFATAMTTTSVSTVRTIALGSRLAASAACSRSLVSPSSCAQGDRSAASVLSLLKTTTNCGKLLGRVKEKFLFVLVNPQEGCPISWDPGVRSDAKDKIGQ